MREGMGRKKGEYSTARGRGGGTARGRGRCRGRGRGRCKGTGTVMVKVKGRSRLVLHVDLFSTS